MILFHDMAEVTSEELGEMLVYKSLADSREAMLYIAAQAEQSREILTAGSERQKEAEVLISRIANTVIEGLMQNSVNAIPITGTDRVTYGRVIQLADHLTDVAIRHSTTDVNVIQEREKVMADRTVGLYVQREVEQSNGPQALFNPGIKILQRVVARLVPKAPTLPSRSRR